MSLRPGCTVCDAPIDPYGRDGTRCDRCKLPCPDCGGVTGFCKHPLRTVESLTEVEHIAPGRIAA